MWIATLWLAAALQAEPAGQLTLAWDANTEADLEGYIVGLGTEPGVYTITRDVKRVTLATIDKLVPGQRYYVIVKAYNTAWHLSSASNIVEGVALPAGTVPPGNPPLVPVGLVRVGNQE